MLCEILTGQPPYRGGSGLDLGLRAEKADLGGAQARLDREVHDALGQALALRERAAAAGPHADALGAQAREQAQRAAALVESGPADPALAARVRELRAELDLEEKDRTLLAALDAA